MNRLEELKQKYKELGEEIKKLEKHGEVWKPKEDDIYYCVEPNGRTEYHRWADDEYDVGAYEVGNCFKIREEAELMREKLKIYTQLKRLAEEINTEPVDYENCNLTKYKIVYDYGAKSLDHRVNYNEQHQGAIYSTNSDFLKIAKERIGEENLLKLFKE